MITLETLSSLQQNEEFINKFKESLNFPLYKKDPQGSNFYYLLSSESNVKPIAVGFFSELNNNSETIKNLISNPKEEFYKKVYGHYLNRQFEEQPALYILFPTDIKKGQVCLIKPTDSGLRLKGSFIAPLQDRNLSIKLNLLNKNSLKVLSGLFCDVPQVDHLFFNAITTAKDLAKELARITRELEHAIIDIYDKENDKGFLHQLHNSFKSELLPFILLKSEDPKEYGFADLYAQTISYGMFSARFFKPNCSFERKALEQYIPPTNPFLRELFKSISDEQEAKNEQYKELFDKIEDLVSTLASVDMDSVLKDFHFDEENQEDIVIHFYETFLQEYNPQQREIRGVYYTPTPVVSYIVRSVDKILKEKFDKPLGIADPEVLILDPATGTGTFLFSIINEVHKYYETALKPKGEKTWDDFVNENILPRIFGFELMMAPYAIAHLKLGLELQKYGYSFNTDKRISVYLTNTLEDTAKKSESLVKEFISNESDEAAVIKKEKPIMVVIGNPPYSGHSANDKKWIKDLVKDYYTCDGVPLGEKTSKWLQDDYIKFLRFAQWRISKTGKGIVAFITNHGYLNNPTFRGVRDQILKTFDEIYIYDLHGNDRKKEKTPEGLRDDNVFDIQQGVSICFLIKNESLEKKSSIYKCDLWGANREIDKYPVLNVNDIKTTEWHSFEPQKPFYLFVDQNIELKAEYDKGYSIKSIFKINGAGITTAHDDFVINYDPSFLINQFKEFKNSEGNPETLHKKFNVKKKKGWNIKKAWDKFQIIDEKNLNDYLKLISYRPFDNRFIFYEDTVVWRTVKQIMLNMKNDNFGIISARSNKSQDMDHFFCTSNIMETKCGERTTQSALFPLYIYDFNNQKIKSQNLSLLNIETKTENFTKDFRQTIDLKYKKHFSTEKIAGYIYAIMHSTEYRTRYSEFLKIDFPKIIFTENIELFEKLSNLGNELINWHLMKTSFNESEIPKFPIEGSNLILKNPTFNNQTKRVYINSEQYFTDISEEVWNFFIGGYKVLEKWLKERKKDNYTLKKEDIIHFCKTAFVLQKTIEIMENIDETIEGYGGWPLV